MNELPPGYEKPRKPRWPLSSRDIAGQPTDADLSAIQRYAPPQDALPSVEFFHPPPPSNRQILCLYTDNKLFHPLISSFRVTSTSNEQGIYER